MTRTIPSGLLTALTAKEVKPYYAVKMAFENQDGTDATIRLWTGYPDRTIDGETYIGSGSLLNIDGIEEVGDLSAKSITLSMSGISSTLIALALGARYQRRVCKVYFGEQSVSDVIQIFSGKMNQISTSDEGETGSISLIVDSKLIELERARNWRYNNRSHRSRYPSDTFFSYVDQLPDSSVSWGPQS